jgi:hypothetical protein
METFQESDSGYPEEAPPEVVPEDAGDPGESAAREGGRQRQHGESGEPGAGPGDAEEGPATGNPRAAG